MAYSRRPHRPRAASVIPRSAAAAPCQQLRVIRSANPDLEYAGARGNVPLQVTASDGGTRISEYTVTAGDGHGLLAVIERARSRFGLAQAVVRSCYEAGRDGFWLHRHLRSIGIDNEVVDAASIEVSRRLRHVKTDRLDGERLLAKLIRHHAGERGGWSVVRVPSIEEEDARHLHRELERLKRERLAHRVRMQSLLVTQGVRMTIKGSARLRLETLALWDGRALPTELRASCAHRAPDRAVGGRAPRAAAEPSNRSRV